MDKVADPSEAGVNAPKIDLLSQVLHRQLEDYRTRGAVLVAGAGISSGLITTEGEWSQLSLVAIGLSFLAAIFGTVSLLPRNGRIVRLSDMERMIRDFGNREASESLYRQELEVAKADEKLLKWRSYWIFAGFIGLVLAILVLGIDPFI